MGKIRSISARCPQVLTDAHINAGQTAKAWHGNIRIEDVHRAFGPVKVLDSVNLRIEEGENRYCRS